MLDLFLPQELFSMHQDLWKRSNENQKRIMNKFEMEAKLVKLSLMSFFVFFSLV
jgi:hypothetical protein